jgi:transglutaminase-like putative cysteine protease
MLRVKTDRLTPLRATSLDTFDGASFTAAGKYAVDTLQVDGSVALNPGASGVVRNTTVMFTEITSKWVFAGGTPTRIDGLGDRKLRFFDDGSLEADPDLQRGTTITITTATPDPGPRKLLDYRDSYPFDLPPLQVEPDGRSVDVPRFGEGTMSVDEFGRLAPIAELSRRIINGASTQYEAVNRMEGYLRANYRYDTSVPAASSPQDELTTFLLTTKTGYCQHFAGAMALMLRMNGIPARVAVGVNVPAASYDKDSKSYVVTDRDAHSWVEVYFGIEYGWLAFDPTPSRFANGNSASVSSTGYVPPTGANVPPRLNRTPVKPAPPTTTPTPTPTATPDVPSDGGRSWGWPAALLVGLISLFVPAGIKMVRRVRRRNGTERDRVLGAARELESWLTDLGVPPDPAATPSERAAATRRSLGIDTATIYGLASDAKFSGHDPAPGAGAAAWRELRTVQRGLGKRARLGAALRSRSLRAP